MKDHFDLVRAFYRHFNAARLDQLADGCDPAIVTERLSFDPSAPEIVRGRDAVVDAARAFHDRYRGGFDDGTHYRLRTVGGIETGWGWVHAEWLQSAVDRATGERWQFSGYSHFLVESGLIRRQRSVREPVADLAAVAADGGPRPRTYPSRPLVGVGAVILTEDGRVVLIKRRHEPLAGQWSLPGGLLELGETLEAGVAREVLEETGLVVDVGAVVEVFDRIVLDETRKVRYHFVLVDYLCRVAAGAPRSASDVTDIALARPDDLDTFGLAPKVVDVIARALGMVTS